MTGYASPIPAVMMRQPRRSVNEEPRSARVHMWPARERYPDFSDQPIPCVPALCRECERERTWSAGQTRGRAV